MGDWPAILQPQPVCNTMALQSMKSLEKEKRLDVGMTGRIPLENGLIGSPHAPDETLRRHSFRDLSQRLSRDLILSDRRRCLRLFPGFRQRPGDDGTVNIACLARLVALR